MNRRDFIAFVGGAAAVWPLAARAQPGERMRRIGVLMNLSADDPNAQANVVTFLKAMQQLGWIDGSNVRIEFRWGTGNADNANTRWNWPRSRRTSSLQLALQA